MLGAPAAWSWYQSDVHSQVLPVIWNRPKPLGGYDLAGAVYSHPSAWVLWFGKSPCQTLAMWRPPGVSSSPHANSAPSSPPRAARSHSASVGISLPAHAA